MKMSTLIILLNSLTLRYSYVMRIKRFTKKYGIKFLEIILCACVCGYIRKLYILRYVRIVDKVAVDWCTLSMPGELMFLSYICCLSEVVVLFLPLIFPINGRRHFLRVISRKTRSSLTNGFNKEKMPFFTKIIVF